MVAKSKAKAKVRKAREWWAIVSNDGDDREACDELMDSSGTLVCETCNDAHVK